jgi:ATP-dependent DNA ligase
MNFDVFDARKASPMLLVEGSPFNSPNYLFELKLDGIRCLAYLGKKTELRNKRNKDVTETYPELKGLNQQVNCRCILDGELIVTENGIPNFFEIQRRSLMTDRFKIKLARPVNFVAYDILYRNQSELINLPLMKRKSILNDTVKENNSIAISRYIEEKGIDFYQLVASKNLEGVVAKKNTSFYYYGKRSKDWIKFKKMTDNDFIICGYSGSGRIKSLVLGAYLANELVYQGHVALGIPQNEAKIIIEYAHLHPCRNPFKESDDNSIKWMKLALVCTVKYMMRTPAGLLRQPVYKGLRFDKTISECLVNRD